MRAPTTLRSAANSATRSGGNRSVGPESASAATTAPERPVTGTATADRPSSRSPWLTAYPSRRGGAPPPPRRARRRRGAGAPPARRARPHPPPPTTPYSFSFFFNDTATTEIYTLSLHDALPISASDRRARARPPRRPSGP